MTRKNPKKRMTRKRRSYKGGYEGEPGEEEFKKGKELYEADKNFISINTPHFDSNQGYYRRIVSKNEEDSDIIQNNMRIGKGKSFDLLKKAAEKGNSEAKLFLAKHYLELLNWSIPAVKYNKERIKKLIKLGFKLALEVFHSKSKLSNEAEFLYYKYITNDSARYYADLKPSEPDELNNIREIYLCDLVDKKYPDAIKEAYSLYHGRIEGYKYSCPEKVEGPKEVIEEVEGPPTEEVEVEVEEEEVKGPPTEEVVEEGNTQPPEVQTEEEENPTGGKKRKSMKRKTKKRKNKKRKTSRK